MFDKARKALEPLTDNELVNLAYEALRIVEERAGETDSNVAERVRIAADITLTTCCLIGGHPDGSNVDPIAKLGL